MMKKYLKVLLADPDRDWLKSAVKPLQENFYRVISVDNGKKAQQALLKPMSGKDYFAVVLNYDLKEHTCEQVLKFMRYQKKKQKIILVLETEELIENGTIDENKMAIMGIYQIMIKPFHFDDLIDELNKLRGVNELIGISPQEQKISAEEKIEILDDQFFDVDIDEFTSSKIVLFDVFVKLSSNNYVKILHAGDTFSMERIKRYKNEKKINKLYMYSDDKLKYIEYNNCIAKKAIGKDYISPHQKVNLLKNISVKYIEDTFLIGLKPQIIRQGMEICESVYELIEKEPRLYLVLRELNDLDPNAFTHSYLVALYASVIVKQFEWHSKMTIETTTMAAMLHDIGKTSLPPEFIYLKSFEMDSNQYRLYMKHSEEGMRLLENVPINNSIKKIILQHHESYNGTGFPHKLKGNKILTLANIVHLADNFVHAIQEEKVKPLNLLKNLLMDDSKVSLYKHTILRNFIKIFADPIRIENIDSGINKKVS